MIAPLRFIARGTWPTWVLLFVCAALFGALGSEIWHSRAIDDLQRRLDLRIALEAANLQVITLDGKAMGAVKLAGQFNNDIRAAAQMVDKQEAQKKNIANHSMNLLARSIDADLAFVVNRQGIISSDWDAARIRNIGLDVGFRPYYRAARQGVENVYGAVSMSNGRRMIYVAAPVYAESGDSGATSGAVVAAFEINHIDDFLGRLENVTGLLVSPHGVVFASSRKDWRLRQLGAAGEKGISELQATRQYGKTFDNSRQPPLFEQTGGKRLSIEGRDYLLSKQPIVWNDPEGNWQLMLLGDIATATPLKERLSIAALVGGLVLLLGGLVVRLLRSWLAQEAAAARLETVAQRQTRASQRKTELSEAARRMQGAASLSELAGIFLSQAHHQLGVLQGTVYLLQPERQSLELIGSYACATAPPENLALGEGLLGQCVVERKSSVIRTDTSAFAMVHSGLGDARPDGVLIVPLMLGETVLGVAELAWLETGLLPDEREQQTEELLALLAVNIEIIGRSQRTEQDLEKLQAAERASSEQAHFQQVLVDTIPYPVFYKGADARFLGFNRAYEETFKVNREDLVGKRVMDLDYLPEADRIAYQAEDEAVIASAGQVRHEMQIPFADGKQHDTLYFVSGFRNADGSPGGLVGTFIDVTKQKSALREMDRLADLERFNRLAQGREQRVLELKREINALAESCGRPAPYNTELVEAVGDHELDPHPDYRNDAADIPDDLSELVDIGELQALLTNFCESVGIASAIIDLEGKILAAARWQRACTDFHRANPDSCKRCIESDTELALQLQSGEEFTLYQCKNGMTDAAAPIVVDGRHLANVFIGQFHSVPPDLEFFRQQARRFGYDETDYLKAIEAAPVINETRLPAILSFLSGFSRMISSLSLARRRADLTQQKLEERAALLKRERIAALSLAEDAEQARIALEAITKESLT